jgi:hypothetical protein
MKTFIAIVCLTLTFNGCYSFTGSSVPPHLKTIAIPLLDDQSGSGEPSLREKLTNKLIDKFRQDNSLQITDRINADAILEGIITSLSAQPQVISSAETVTKQHITITVKVMYQDMKLRKKLWEKQFSEWGEYALGGGIQERDAAIDAANEKITEDILLETVSGW